MVVVVHFVKVMLVGGRFLVVEIVVVERGFLVIVVVVVLEFALVWLLKLTFLPGLSLISLEFVLIPRWIALILLSSSPLLNVALLLSMWWWWLVVWLWDGKVGW